MSSRVRARTLATVTEQIAAHRDDRLTIAVTDLEAAAPRFLEACQRMQDARPSTLGAASYDGPGITGSGVSNPTARLALTPDRFASDRLMLDVALSTLVKYARYAPRHHVKVCAAAHNLRRIVAVWTPKAPTDRQRRSVEHANDASDECALTRDALSLWTKRYRTSNLGGLLPDPVPVGRWVYDFAKTHGRLPTPMEWKHHASRDDDLRRQMIQTVRVG